MTDAPETVTDAVRLLVAEGYTVDFRLVDGALVWEGAQAPCPVAEADVQRMFRFEGESDPGDEMVVFGLVDPGTGAKGTLASAFGPAAGTATGGVTLGRRRGADSLGP